MVNFQSLTDLICLVAIRCFLESSLRYSYKKSCKSTNISTDIFKTINYDPQGQSTQRQNYQGNARPTALQRDDVQQHEEERQTQPWPKVCDWVNEWMNEWMHEQHSEVHANFVFVCRYFQMVVGLYAAVAGGEMFLLTALLSERIIVRVTTLNQWTIN